MRTRSTLIAILLACSSTFAGAVAEVRYRAGFDFSGKTAIHLAVDRDGSVLSGTDSGIVRWNGTRMEPIQFSKALGAVHRDRKGNLWTQYDTDRPSQSYLVRGGKIMATGTWVMDVAEDDSGVAWVATQIGLYAFRDTTLIYHPTFKTDSLSEYLNTLAFDGAGNLWVAGCKGIARISPDRKIDYVAPNGWFQSIRKAPDGAMWASESGGLLRWDGTSWVAKATTGSSDHIAFGSDGRLYVRSRGCILVWNGTALDTFSKALPSLNSSYAPDLIADKQGRLWTTSGIGAVAELDIATGSLTNHPLYEDGFPGIGIYDVMPDSLGRVWVATTEGHSLHDAKGRRTFPVRAIHGLVERKAGEIWGVTYQTEGDIFRFVNDSISQLKAPNVIGLAASSNGEIAAASSSTIYRYRGEASPTTETLDSTWSLTLGYCPDGRLVVGGYYSQGGVNWKGFAQSTGGKWFHDFSTWDYPMSVWCDAQGDLWYGDGSYFYHRHGKVSNQLPPPNYERQIALLASPKGQPYVVSPSGVYRPDAKDSLVPVAGWDSASVRKRGLTMEALGHARPGGAEALWTYQAGNVLFLDDAPWRNEVGIGIRTASPHSSSLNAFRRPKGWTVTWSGEGRAELVATDLAGRTAWRGSVASGGSVSLDRPERFLVLRASSSGSQVEVRKLAVP